MATYRTHTKRATTWLCLAIAVLIALMPAGGLMVCWGDDGHVRVEVASETDSCPCEGDSAGETGRASVHQQSKDRHPPCDDVAVEAPRVFKDAELGQKLPRSTDNQLDDDSASGEAWGAHGSWGTGVGSPVARWSSPAAVLPRQQLDHGRTVVLLI